MAKRIVIIGAVALGPKAASRCKRLMPARVRLKPVLSFKFTNPSADAVQMVSHNVSDLLP